MSKHKRITCSLFSSFKTLCMTEITFFLRINKKCSLVLLSSALRRPYKITALTSMLSIITIVNILLTILSSPKISVISCCPHDRMFNNTQHAFNRIVLSFISKQATSVAVNPFSNITCFSLQQRRVTKCEWEKKSKNNHRLQWRRCCRDGQDFL